MGVDDDWPTRAMSYPQATTGTYKDFSFVQNEIMRLSDKILVVESTERDTKTLSPIHEAHELLRQAVSALQLTADRLQSVRAFEHLDIVRGMEIKINDYLSGYSRHHTENQLENLLTSYAALHDLPEKVVVLSVMLRPVDTDSTYTTAVQRLFRASHGVPRRK